MKCKRLARLFLTFFRFGCCTFGGGWSIVAQIQQKYVEQEQALQQEELLDLTSVSRSLPGTMIGNVAMLLGYRMEGIPGGLACTVGLVLPPMLILTIITLFYSAFRASGWCMALMGGVRAAVVPMILTAALAMVRGAFSRKSSLVLFLAGLIAYTVFEVNCIVLIVLGAVCGLLLERPSRGGADPA